MTGLYPIKDEAGHRIMLEQRAKMHLIKSELVALVQSGFLPPNSASDIISSLRRADIVSQKEEDKYLNSLR